MLGAVEGDELAAHDTQVRATLRAARRRHVAEVAKIEAQQLAAQEANTRGYEVRRQRGAQTQARHLPWAHAQLCGVCTSLDGALTPFAAHVIRERMVLGRASTGTPDACGGLRKAQENTNTATALCMCIVPIRDDSSRYLPGSSNYLFGVGCCDVDRSAAADQKFAN